MDFIEKLFGLSPDNGDGSTEVMWLVALALAIAVFFYVRHRRKARGARLLPPLTRTAAALNSGPSSDRRSG